MDEKRDALEAELRCLSSDLYYGEFGDWKIAKCYEATIRGVESPYDIEELHTKRQEMRDRINEIKEQLKNDEL